VRVTAQLIQVSDQTHTGAHSFERPLGDMVALQSDIAGVIAAEIGVQFTPRERVRFASPRPVDPRVYGPT
jgi:TolB-like protein